MDSVNLAPSYVRAVAGADEIRRELLGTRSADVLSLADIASAGRAFFGDPEAIALYGSVPSIWYADGIRITGRTCVEAVPDASGRRIAQNVKHPLAKLIGQGSAGIVDLFAGSGNLMYHLSEVFDAVSAGMEIDPLVYRLTASNLAKRGSRYSQLRLGSWESYFDDPLLGVDATIFVIAPPWGDAFSFKEGLDLRKTTPPVIDVMKCIDDRTAGRNRYALVQVPTHETVNPESLNQLVARYRLVASAPACLLFALGGPGE